MAAFHPFLISMALPRFYSSLLFSAPSTLRTYVLRTLIPPLPARPVRVISLPPRFYSLKGSRLETLFS